ncbi:hypothetical protein C1Y40_00600 [Mycobacterium talmoniae]|uniref:Uncharacterized protein n=1 Tax=Mycobacterium talmoniae TaxID=1858794 RepID=A0A2S8BRC0_9MYCO|nr:hypothetical protein C1Y40_00600 [Mycobacterium talmoniae]
MSEDLPTSRVSRGAALGKLAAKQTLRRVVIKAGSIAVSETRARRCWMRPTSGWPATSWRCSARCAGRR